VAIPGRLHPVDLAAGPGELIALIGPNGGGKTSLLRALARVDGATGMVMLDGEQVDAMAINRRRKLVAFLPASHETSWPIPVRDYIALSDASRDAIDRWMVEFDVDNLAERPVDRLSTGERSRVMLARTLAANPVLALLDEPLSNLEPYWVLRALQIMRREADRGAIVLASLHDLHQLGSFDRVLMLARGQVLVDALPGTIVGTPEFERTFRVGFANGQLALRPTAGPRSSP
jgi:iron complex transport system ATP-binding protein